MTVLDNLGVATPTRAVMPASGLETIVRAQPEYPPQLERLSRPPAILWCRGRFGGASLAAALPALTARSVAIVGSRAASRQAMDRTSAIAAELARAGFTIVSGGAYGIDAAAHEGALAAGGPTLAVLGCGADVIYPEQHATLFARIAEGGGLLSQFPPGTRPLRHQFPLRNWIVAGLVQAVVVVEAARRSGALITAGHASALGIPLVAVPGSPGTDGLIGAGRAHTDPTPSGLRQALAGVAPRITSPSIPPGHPLGPLVDALRSAPQAADGLSRRLGLPLPVVLIQLSQAEIAGWVRRAPGGAYEVTRVQ